MRRAAPFPMVHGEGMEAASPAVVQRLGASRTRGQPALTPTALTCSEPEV